MADGKGIIYRISGPVVIADGLVDPKMYDVVKVGEEGLIGEIIKLNAGKATIQVYENTGGLKPGDPVTSTGTQLSVTLGPGLIGSIFDGIQRPLDKIKEKSGDFIARGVDVDAIDMKKKWKFVPTAKKGDKVKAGDIIGEVDETSLVKHKVMVPWGMDGTISDISEGSFKLADTVATVTNGSKEFKLSLMQKWPVRVARPVLEKLPPDVPLITGQRIIDTFFPVAKGGTAAVPGPFGSGKCVTGDTPIMLSDGVVTSIENLYKKSATDREVRKGTGEEFIDIDEGVGLFSFNKQKIMESNSQMMYKGSSSSIVKVRTRTGKIAKVTPIHKLFKITETGEIIETMAKDLKIGDYIASARKIDAKRKDAKIDIYGLDELRTIDPEIRSLIAVLSRRVRQQKINISISKTTLDNLSRKEGAVRPKLKWIKEVCNSLNAELPTPLYFVGDTYSTPVLLPIEVSKELAEFLGYYISEGNIRGNNTVVFTNSEEPLLERFLWLSKKLFGIEGKIERQAGKTPGVLLFSTVIVRFLRYLEVGKNSKSKRIPDCIMQSSDASLGAFLTSYYIGDGGISGGDIELTTASKELQIQLSYALARFGAIHTLADRIIDGVPYYRVFIRGISNLKIMASALAPTHKKVLAISEYIKSKSTTYDSIDVVPLSPSYISDIYRKHLSYKQLLQLGIEIHNYIGNGERMGASIFKKFAGTVSVNAGNMMQLTHLGMLAQALEYIYCDRIVSIEETEGNFDVYDVSVPDFGSNFVGGVGGLILHNTVIQQQLAKWSDSDIVVYVGCGERGNEMTEILTTFPKLTDPKTGKPIMDRTILIANTSNMPVAAREASIYTGITLAEYYRDMGYSVALMADSTSRWAEALREISGRLEEMPGEEGYPAYLGRKVAEFYERAGRVNVLNGSVGSVTAIGAVSPPGGDTSEPVSQNTLRVTRVFWALDASLANRRHFPSINWLNSYSLYLDDLAKWYSENVDKEWNEFRGRAMGILQKEAEINEVVQLVGYDALPEKEKEVLDIAKSIREDYLQQSAYDDVDTYTSSHKQYLMLKSILALDDAERHAIDKGVIVEQLRKVDAKQKLARMKFTKEDDIDTYYEDLKKAIDVVSKMETKAK